ncbi:MAG: hypothetical protein KDJ26_03520 [Alphaproteobacteria bacterium]|jgi:hypothetical protein|nr:hypothetical protein [Alphaproteobacteria bacterium]MCB1551052.1 hypothetical protein [Alphaproteobacteria bacterium]MCB9985500.1 hypothetical protein [Micavibrio sp.]HPQ50192.1 hypothetical protein [Alphaproteobacteria bacterium]
MRGFFVFLIGFSILLGAVPVQAEEQLMNLWSNQRLIHNREMDMKSEAYRSRGQDYVDNLYATGGEILISDPEWLHPINLDEYPMIEPVPVDVNEVADIIKAQDGQ